METDCITLLQRAALLEQPELNALREAFHGAGLDFTTAAIEELRREFELLPSNERQWVRENLPVRAGLTRNLVLGMIPKRVVHRPIIAPASPPAARRRKKRTVSKAQALVAAERVRAWLLENARADVKAKDRARTIFGIGEGTLNAILSGKPVTPQKYDPVAAKMGIRPEELLKPTSPARAQRAKRRRRS